MERQRGHNIVCQIKGVFEEDFVGESLNDAGVGEARTNYKKFNAIIFQVMLVLKSKNIFIRYLRPAEQRSIISGVLLTDNARVNPRTACLDAIYVGILGMVDNPRTIHNNVDVFEFLNYLFECLINGITFGDICYQ